jgi:division protein CdvB (Snf7/Vps24/ESCRT-III family)
MGKHQQFMSDILTASTVVHNQLTRLNMLDKKFILMDKDLRYKIAANIKVGNNATARSLAIELANIHRVQRTTRNMSLALEVVVIRFSTINEFAMVLDTINPTIDMIKEIQSDISRSVPAASNLLSEMTSVTSDVLHNSNIKSEAGKISTSMDADALSILNEVEGILEDEAKSRLPEVPTTIQEVRIRREVDEVTVKDDRMMIESYIC